MNDRDILISALANVRRREEAGPPRGFLSVPSDEDTTEVAEAIERCEVFKAAQGKYLFSAGAFTPVHSDSFASRLISRADQRFAPKDLGEAADWLLRMLSTTSADGLFIAAVWGLAIDNPLHLSETESLVPFQQLQESYLADAIRHRAGSYGGLWTSQRFWKVPSTAYVHRISDFPYIVTTDAPVLLLEKLADEAKDLWTFLEVAGAGGPLVFGSWFEYVDKDLDISAHENAWAWNHPEVAPRIIQDRLVEALELERSSSSSENSPLKSERS